MFDTKKILTTFFIVFVSSAVLAFIDFQLFKSKFQAMESRVESISKGCDEDTQGILKALNRVNNRVDEIYRLLIGD